MIPRRSGWVEAVALIHLLPGVMTLLAVSCLLWLGGLSAALAWTSGKEEWVGLIGILFGGVALFPASFALPFFCVGLGLLRRRAWARFVAIYLAAGLAGTGLVLALVEENLLGLFPLAHASLTLVVLLAPRSAVEFGGAQSIESRIERGSRRSARLVKAWWPRTKPTERPKEPSRPVG